MFQYLDVEKTDFSFLFTPAPALSPFFVLPHPTPKDAWYKDNCVYSLFTLGYYLFSLLKANEASSTSEIMREETLLRLRLINPPHSLFCA